MKGVTRLPLGGSQEPAVRNPELARMVEVARRQAPPRLTVDAERVHVAWKERRARRWRSLAMLAAAALVGLVGTSLLRGLPRGGEPDASLVAEATVQEPEHETSASNGVDTTRSEDVVAVAAPVAEALAPGVRVEPRSADAAYTVLGPWSVDVAAGVYEMAAPIEAASSLHVRVGGRTLVLEPGGMVRLEVGPRPEAVLLSGEAAWIERDGRRTSLSAGAATRRSDASTLARQAERLMAAGDRKGAIAAYRTLVRKYPRSSSARAALVDLARLLKAAGDNDGARCAYAQILEQWPNNHLRPEIERELQRLGPGPKCQP
jgi:hypothetical protein